LIKEAKSAEQIAGVLAHEMSHATLVFAWWTEVLSDEFSFA